MLMLEVCMCVREGARAREGECVGECVGSRPQSVVAINGADLVRSIDASIHREAFSGEKGEEAMDRERGVKGKREGKKERKKEGRDAVDMRVVRPPSTAAVSSR